MTTEKVSAEQARSRNRQKQVDLWSAINEYAESCGGDTNVTTPSDRRMNAVVAVEDAITSYLAQAAAAPPLPAEVEAAVEGAGGLEDAILAVCWLAEERGLSRDPDIKDALDAIGDFLRTLRAALSQKETP